MASRTHLSRRRVSGLGAGLAALCASGLLAGCGGPLALAAPPRSTGADPDLQPQPDSGWTAWVAGFRPRALANGITPATYDRAFRSAGFLPGVIQRDRNQTEFTRSLQDYLAIAASDERVSLGRQMVARHQRVLAAVEERYGTDRYVVAAIWGLESFYGTRPGEVPVVSALSTLAYEGRRASFFEGQLIAALKILQHGDVAPEAMTGSWAGAMGHTQFIPTSYQAYAVDFDGDGRRDIWSDDPADSLASTANYLARSGWVRGQPWGMEVQVPAGYAGTSGRSNRQSVAAWTAAGVRAMDGGTVADHGSAALLLPEGAQGPAFLVFRNFDVILRYNNAENYAIGIGHLSDRLRGLPPLRASFPPDRYGLTIDDRKALQAKLTAAGYDAGTPDGVLGAKTAVAISAWQGAHGVAVTGEPSRALLAAL